MIAALDDIRSRIVPQIEAKGVPSAEQDVNIEADQDLDGYDFVRVSIKLPKREFTDTTLEELLESIEGSVAEIDDRHVSVRFDDAA